MFVKFVLEYYRSLLSTKLHTVHVQYKPKNSISSTNLFFQYMEFMRWWGNMYRVC